MDGRESLNVRRVGIFGFSLGGFTSLVLIGGTPELARMAQLCAANPAAPESAFIKNAHGDLRGVSVPVQIWRAENDTQARDAWNGAVVRDGLEAHPDAHLVERVDHFVFLAPCNVSLAAAAPQICRDPSGFDRAAFHRIFNQAAVDFFTTRLRER